jgi:sugar lactone lactonase YvrE
MTPNDAVATVDIITTIVGSGAQGFSGDNGQATAGTLNNPCGVALDTSDNIYIADYSNCRIRKVTIATGIITTIAGTGTASYSFSGDNGPATSAGLFFPRGVALDSSGNVYIADTFNNCVRKVTISTGIITTIAGTGSNGFSGDNGPATSATFYEPNGVTIDLTGEDFEYFVLIFTGILTSFCCHR